MFDLKVPDRLKAAFSDSDFTIYAKKSSDDVELLIMEDIGKDAWTGEGLSAKDVSVFLADNQDSPVHVRINSSGGLVYDGMQIYNGLANHRAGVTVTIEGLAFSAASMIAMAGKRIRMHEASDIGIHRAWGAAIGNAKAMRGVAEWLDTIDTHLIDIYESRSGQSRASITKWIDGTDDGTLFPAKKAVELGFADEVIEVSRKGEKPEARIAESKDRLMSAMKSYFTAIDRYRK